jgi:outer membrane protein
MKWMKLLGVSLMLMFVTSAAQAQRFAYVDSEYILQHIPEYLSAQKQLDDLSIQWQEEVDQRFAQIEVLYKEYQENQVLMSEEARRKKEDEIILKEREAKEYQRLKFGFEGDLHKERIKLIQPIQERVAKAIQQLAEEQGLDFILDRGSEITFLYANPKLDKSADIITRLGYKPNPNKLNP